MKKLLSLGVVTCLSLAQAQPNTVVDIQPKSLVYTRTAANPGAGQGSTASGGDKILDMRPEKPAKSPKIASSNVLGLRPKYTPHGSIERLDTALDALIDPDVNMEFLATGFTWAEGPVWLKRENALVFSDVPENRIHRWSEKRGLEVYLEPSGYTGSAFKFRETGSNGLTTDEHGHLVICQHGDRQISRLEKRDGLHGTFTPLAQYYQGRRLNTPNDLCFSRSGNLYFTDPPYGLEGLNQSPIKELAFNGVYLRRPDGEIRLLTAGMTFPNGIALSPDEKTLYVCQSDPAAPIIARFPVRPDGTVGEKEVFFDASALAAQGRKGMPDGLKVDIQGNLWATGPGGLLIISPTGKHLGTLVTGVPTANCNWGGDGSVLYITANHDLLRIQTRTRGAAF